MSGLSGAPFEPVVGWEQLPTGYQHKDCSDVAVDSRDRVYLLTRGDSQILVYEPDGTFVRRLGDGVLGDDPHGITIGPDDRLYCADRGAHVVRVLSPEGEQLQVIGTEGVPSDSGFDPGIKDPRDRENAMRPAGPFNRPTKVAVAPNGDLYVTDGYGNTRVHQFDASGVLIRSWGQPGGGPGDFRLPHCVLVLPDGRLLVADRENSRIQVFTQAGEVLEVWDDVQRPEGFVTDGKHIFVGCAPDGPPNPSAGFTERTGVDNQAVQAKLAILDMAGRTLERYDGGDPDDTSPGCFISISGIAMDSEGDLYICQNTEAARRSLGLHYDDGLPVVQKLRRTRAIGS